MDSILTFCLSVVNKYIRFLICSKIASKQHHSMTILCEFGVVRKTQVTLSDVSHTFYGKYELLPSAQRCSHPTVDCLCNRSFIKQGWATLVLESHCPSCFPTIPYTLQAGLWLSGDRVGNPSFIPSSVALVNTSL